MWSKKFVLIFFLILLPCLLPISHAQTIYIDVGEAKVKKSLLALPKFTFLSTPSLAPKHKAIGAELYNTIHSDLTTSNLFTFIDPDAFLEDSNKKGLTPAPGNPNGFKFDSWSQIGTDFLIKAGYRIIGKKKLELEIYVYHVPQAKLVMGKKYSAKVKDVRTTAHTFADDLMKALTGKKGFFRTKFVVSSDRAGGKFKEIYVMDWDGRKVKPVTRHRSISLSPSWSPDGKSISYTSFAYHPKLKRRNVDLFTFDLYTGKRYLVSSYNGVNSGSVYSPDGDWIYLTQTKGTGANIYRINIEGKQRKQITFGRGGTLSVEPAITPDGRKVVFSSDRKGGPMIYIKPIGRGKPRRLTFAGRYNASPSVSPDGKRIAFAGYDKGHFDIFVMDIDGTNLKRLTSAKRKNGKWANNEDPSFSPDGRFIVFTSNRTGRKQIFIVSVDGKYERQITVDRFNYFKPRWSPFLN